MDPAFLTEVMQLALQYHEEERAFWIFEALYKHSDVNTDEVAGWLLRYPHLVFNLLRALENDEKVLPPPFDSIRYTIIEAVIMSVNEAPIASLVAIEKLKIDISELTFREYCTLLWKASMIARSRGAFQEMLLVLEEQREKNPRDPASEHAYRQSLQVAFERAEDSFENCPCDEQGRPTKQRTAPVRVKLHPKRPKAKPTEKNDEKKEQGHEPESKTEDEKKDDQPSEEHQAVPPPAAVVSDSPTTGINLPTVVADIRVDKPSTARLHSHVRLTAASKPDKEDKWWKREILDGVVKVSFKGEIEIELFQHPPPEYASMEWNMYDCGSTATTRAMMDAVIKLHTQKYEASGMFGLLSGIPNTSDFTDIPAITAEGSGWEKFNDSQRDAIVKACNNELSLIWGPPGNVYVHSCA
jgi:regulator of nonsense transcripts 1